jgi:hypothetical protein
MKQLTFLAACKATDSRNKALEEMGAEVILAAFRMFKNSLVHAIENRAVAQTITESHTIIIDFAAIVGGQVSITFVDDTIFVCGQLLRASRSIYESAMEVGKLLGRVGVSEVSFTAEVTVANLMDMCAAFSIATRNPDQRGHLLEAKLENCAVRKVDSSLQSKDDENKLPPMERTLRA